MGSATSTRQKTRSELTQDLLECAAGLAANGNRAWNPFTVDLVFVPFKCKGHQD